MKKIDTATKKIFARYAGDCIDRISAILITTLAVAQIYWLFN